MKYVFSTSLFVSGVLTVYYALQFLWSREREYVENRLLAVLCMASMAWSFGSGALILQTDSGIAHWCRCVNMAAVFLYLIMMQVLACYISGVPERIRKIFNMVSLTGIIIYFGIIQKDQVVYHRSSIGMTFSYRGSMFNIIYMIYLFVVLIDIFAVAVYMMRRFKIKRLQVFGQKLLLAELILISGLALDMVYSFMGSAAVPGSSLTQCWSMVTLYYAVHVINRSKINLLNMSEFIYYSLAMPVLVCDAGRRIHIMNDAAVSFSGVDREELEASDVNIARMFTVDEKEVYCFEGNHHDLDAVSIKGRVECSLAVSKINDGYGDVIGYIIIVTDMSERIRSIRELEEAKQEAEAANKAKSTFLAKMSHEIRTPMNAIVGFSELALKSELSKQVREYVEDIKGASNNLLAIINDILDISKIESGKMELVCAEYYPARLFHDVYLIIDTQVKKKGLDFFIEVDKEIPSRLYGDKIRIRSILINILNNAVKYTQEGSVSFEAGVLEKNGSKVMLQFRVTDTGMGIKPEEQGRLFENFSQIDQKAHYGVEGTGLGLAIVKGYVTLMGGYVTVDSVYGEGSTFTVVIEQEILDESPLDQLHIKEDENADGFSLGSMKVHGVRALVVDDNQVNLKVAGSSLSYYGLQVDKASSGMEAVALCKKNHYDMVFMDQMMPQMDGVEAMRRIRQIDAYYAPNGPCRMIVLTADSVSGVRSRLIEEGFDEYLGKPMNYQQLERLFQRFLPKEKLQTSLVQQADPAQEEAGMQEKEKLQKMLPQLDVAQGVKNCGGRMQDYLGMLQVVYHSGEKQLEELRELQSKQNYADYTIKIHALKGTALNMGANAAAEMARLQEQAGKRGEYSYIDAHMEGFLQEYQELLVQVQTVLAQYDLLGRMEQDMQEQGRALTNEDTLHILQEIAQSIDEFDYAKAADLVRETGERELLEKYRPIFVQLGQWMDEMDIDSIQEMIEKLCR